MEQTTTSSRSLSPKSLSRELKSWANGQLWSSSTASAISNQSIQNQIRGPQLSMLFFQYWVYDAGSDGLEERLDFDLLIYFTYVSTSILDGSLSVTVPSSHSS